MFLIHVYVSFIVLSQNPKFFCFFLKWSSSPDIVHHGTYAPEARRLFTTRLLDSRNFSEYSARSRVVNKRESRKFRVPGGGLFGTAMWIAHGILAGVSRVGEKRRFGVAARSVPSSLSCSFSLSPSAAVYFSLSLSMQKDALERSPRRPKAAKMLNSPGTIRPSN